MKNIFKEMQLLGMLLTVLACLKSVRQIVDSENLYEKDPAINTCLDTAIVMVNCCKDRMDGFLKDYGDEDD